MKSQPVNQPSLRTEWVRVFFVAAVFVGPTFFWLHIRSSAPQSGVIYIVGGSMICAAFATAVMRKVAAQRGSNQGQAGHCPEIGGFLHYPRAFQWIASSPLQLVANPTAGSGSLKLRGDGSCPSPAQIDLCKQIGQKMEFLTNTVISALLGNQENHWRDLGFRLTPESLLLRVDGTAELSFEVAGLPDSLATKLNPCAKLLASLELLGAGWFDGYDC